MINRLIITIAITIWHHVLYPIKNHFLIVITDFIKASDRDLIVFNRKVKNTVLPQNLWV
jgi:hypothetical protein